MNTFLFCNTGLRERSANIVFTIKQNGPGFSDLFLTGNDFWEKILSVQI